MGELLQGRHRQQSVPGDRQLHRCAVAPVVALQVQGQATQGRDLSTLAPLPALRSRTPDRTWGQRAVGEGVTVLSESRMREICTSGSMSVAPFKRVNLSRLRWRPRQSLASSRVPSLAWCPVTAAAKRKQGGCRPERSEREDSPEIERDRSSRPCRSKGKAESQAAIQQVAWGAPGVRTASMQPKGLTRTREIHPVQTKVCRSRQADEVREARRPDGSQTD